jgi:hypothetical protein
MDGITVKQIARLGCAGLLVPLVLGCGRTDSGSPKDQHASSPKTELLRLDQAVGQTPNAGRVDAGSEILPTSGVRDAQDADVEETSLAVPDKETPEWFILQITRLRTRPLGDQVDAVTQTPEQLVQLRRERNEQIIELATEAIARTHKDQEKQRVFDLAVHHLLDAEYQLALTGDEDHVKALYEHASSLLERDPKSKAAVEAAVTLCALARVNVQRYAQQEPRWLQEYARLAQEFARNFPQEERQAIQLLLAAGQSCEYHRLLSDAKQCYLTLIEQFPQHESVQKVSPILRRLNLKGNTLQLAGPTLGGGYLNVSELTGKPLLVVIWTTHADPFVKQLPALQKLLQQIPAERLTVVSVNLDDDDNDAAVQTFLESNGLNWPTIFQTEAGSRGWNNPIATYYGIQTVPHFWLVSSKGTVIETSNHVDQIEPLLRRLIPSPATNSTNTRE